MYEELILAFLASAVLTYLFKEIFTRTKGNLYTSVRGGTPRAVGLAPFLVLLLFLEPPYQYLIGIIGLFAFSDDLVGRKRINGLPFELGQLSRGIGMLLVMAVGFYYNFGALAILIALMIQPMNIADMQPGTACSTVITMALLVVLGIFALTSTLYYPALLIMVVCLGYATLDYQGKIMMGEVGNHSFGVGLGILYAVLGGIVGNSFGFGSLGIFLFVMALFLLTSIFIAFLRRKNLEAFIKKNLKIQDPNFGDYTMDVLTGGGLGDLVRKIILKKRCIKINNKLLKILGFRRLFFNPYAAENDVD